MMKKMLITVIMLTAILSHGQALRKSSLSAGGGSGESAGGMYLAYAVGEIGVREAVSGNLYLSEGFIGPDLYAIMDVEGYQILTGIKLFPNPVKKDLHLNFSYPADYEIRIYDLGGKEIYSTLAENAGRFTVDVSSFRAGTYVIGIADRKSKKFAALKFVKP
jgi:hypothetical protein